MLKTAVMAPLERIQQELGMPMRQSILPQSDYGGGSKDYLSYSILGVLMREGQTGAVKKEAFAKTERGSKIFQLVRNYYLDPYLKGSYFFEQLHYYAQR